MPSADFTYGFLKNLIILLILASCQSNQRELPLLEEPLLKGSPTPVLIDSERSIIPLGDYVHDPFRVDSVTTDGPFALEIDNSNIILYGRPAKTLYCMTIWTEGIGESLLIRAVKKSLHSFLYTGQARGVKIKGDFNDWDPGKNIMKRNGRAFSSYVLLSPGRYEYRFIVDGRETTDPLNKDSVRDESGKWNSVLTITTRGNNNKQAMQVIASTSESVEIAIPSEYAGIYVFWKNTPLSSKHVKVEADQLVVSIPSNAEKVEQSTLKIWLENDIGVVTDIQIPLRFGKPVE